MLAVLRSTITLSVALLSLIISNDAHATGQAQSSDLSYECNLSGSIADGLVGCPVTRGPLDTVYTTIAGNTDVHNISCRTSGTTGPYCGARIQGTAVTPIEAWGTCAWINNTSSNALFVPFRTSAEWSSFLATAPSIGGLAIIPCTEPTSSPNDPANGSATPPYTACNTTTIHTPDVYGHYNSSTWPVPENTSPSQPSLTCHNSATTIQSLLRYKAGNPAASGADQYKWTPDFHFSPDVTLTAVDLANPSNSGTSILISVGDSASLNWSTSGAAIGQSWSCTASGSWGGVKVTTTSTATTGSQVITPDGIGSYTLSCTDNYGLTSTTSVTVNVSGVCGADGGITVYSTPTNLCYGLDYATNLSYDGHTWTWLCNPDAGGVAQACMANMCISNWVTTDTTACSATCGGGTQTITQVDGCGHTQNLDQSCNTNDCPIPTINIDAASYGNNCGTGYGNVTDVVASMCDGSPTCSFAEGNWYFGDPRYGCPKDFSVYYNCGSGEKSAYSPPRAGEGYGVYLSCP